MLQVTFGIRLVLPATFAAVVLIVTGIDFMNVSFILSKEFVFPLSLGCVKEEDKSSVTIVITRILDLEELDMALELIFRPDNHDNFFKLSCNLVDNS